MILFTVPDSAIAEVWQQAKPYVSGKVIGHCSGLYSSDIFSDWDSTVSYTHLDVYKRQVRGTDEAEARQQ